MEQDANPQKENNILPHYAVDDQMIFSQRNVFRRKSSLLNQ
jgi:hypothetical protein